ncbi:UPF0261 domain-containing protein [Stachybotrys elegans]|uniref:UPF0261 domain-containing protein n=1 Tax=Stachybotrys elegans TaxID=80388 RepID=A0A8K0SIR1_9HYPO|nr:UPF0261 domain-containing protein [Stachybotrys elegans]
MACVVLLGSCDTKLEEFLYLRNCILDEGSMSVLLIDVGRNTVEHEAISANQRDLFLQYGGAKMHQDMTRADFVAKMTDYATRYIAELYEQDRIHGIAAAGGSSGTSLVAPIMRTAVPVGFPKLIVSTIASGDTGPLVEETDIAMMYSVVDIAGLNQLLRDIFHNAGAAIAGSARAYAGRRQAAKRQDVKKQHVGGPAEPTKKRVGITMFGVTTPGVDAVRKHLESNYPIEVFVFHATGHGGKAMERLVREGRLDAVLDLTTTEICDHITGGNMSAGPHRLEAAAEAGIPYIVSLGATDMTNFGAMSTVPEQYKQRLLYEHNAVVTLMRSSDEENRRVAAFISDKLRQHAKQPEMVEVWIPKGGVSIMSVPDGPFSDPEADEVLFSQTRQGLEGSGIEVVEDPRHVNDAGFARDIAEALAAKMGMR